jgi:hypothetical protein
MSGVAMGQRAMGQRAITAQPCRLVKTGRKVVTKVYAKADPSKNTEQYIGFEKGDYARPEGRKGRVIKDNPDKYPDKDNLGFFLGATGGWAGGEMAVQKIADEYNAVAPSSKLPKNPKSTWPRPSAPPKMKAGQEVQYLGYGKDELDVRKSGAKGRVVIDYPARYPGKDNIGPLLGVSGGFAGGENGINQFIDTGNIKFRKPGEPGRNQFSTVGFAGTVALFGTVGALLLNEAVGVVEKSDLPKILQGLLGQ